MSVLLITGAIDINKSQAPFTRLIDLDERVRQYLHSIEYAIKNYSQINHIVFCENTNYNFDSSYLYELAADNKKILEIISFSGNAGKVKKLGKGYGESEIIKYAINNSVSLQNCNYFYKLTGRIIVKNMDSIIRHSKALNAFLYYPSDVYYYYKNHISTVFYKVDKELYIRKLIDLGNEVDDFKGIYLEHLFLSALEHSDIKSFSVFPIIAGQSGSTCDEYELRSINKSFEIFRNCMGIHDLSKSFSAKIFSVFFAKIVKLRLCFVKH
jgi:hypothetical protein